MGSVLWIIWIHETTSNSPTTAQPLPSPEAADRRGAEGSGPGTEEERGPYGVTAARLKKKYSLQRQNAFDLSIPLKFSAHMLSAVTSRGLDGRPSPLLR